MGFIGSVGGSNASQTVTNPSQGTLGDAAPISFPGVASGIDYNAIIQKYTAATLLQEQPLQTNLNKLNAASAETLKIQNLLGALQDSLKALSDPNVFNSFSSTFSSPGVATATQTSGQTPTTGTYQIIAQTAATATTVRNDSAANSPLDPTVALVNSGAAVTPTNGSAANGSITINGVKINYDANTDSLNSVIANINAQSGTTNVTAAYNAATGKVTFTSTGQPLVLGSAADSGNLLDVLHFTSAQIVSGGGNQSITSTTTIAGINRTALLSGTGNAGFADPVTSGFFTINGAQINVDNTKDAVGDIIKRINASSAGVTASYDTSTNSIVLTNKTPGAQNIVLGSSADTSNFLVAAGLSSTYGNFTASDPYTYTGIGGGPGTQAKVTYLDSSGATVTTYSNNNSFTNVIPGFTLKLSTTTSTPYTVNVATDPKTAEDAIGAFVTAYNKAIDELNFATAPPLINQTTSSTTGQKTASQTTTGGPLYLNFQISQLRDRLVRSVSSFVNTGSTSYNSLSSIGLKLDTALVSTGTTDSDDSTSSSSSSSSSSNSKSLVTATSGKLAALDTTKFEAALNADSSAIQKLFTSVPTVTSSTAFAPPTLSGLNTVGVAYSIGAFLTDATGLPTLLANGLAGTVPAFSLLNTILSTTSQQIDTVQEQIALINQQANLQADSLRKQFTASEALIAQYQSVQSQIAQLGR